jgi:putative sigma-54 modulation protein
MRIDVIGKHMTVTDAIRQYAETKLDKLPKYWDGVQQMTTVFEQDRHGKFRVEVRVDVVKHKDFIAHTDGDDLYACIDLAVDKVLRQLKDYKEKLRS